MSNGERIAARVARHLWERDGKPERHPGEPTSVGRDWYDERAKEVVDGLLALGFVITKPAPKC